MIWKESGATASRSILKICKYGSMAVKELRAGSYTGVIVKTLLTGITFL